jgi:hypothetical protein
LSRPRSAGARAALPSALIAAAALTGCGAQSSVSTTAATAQASKAATPAATPTPAAVHYVLSAPSTIGQWTLTTPTSTTQQKMQQGLSTAEQTLGISGGSPVMGLYNDSADQDWVVFLGMNGSGFDPSKLVTAANTAPRYTTDGTGDNVSWTWVPNLAGGPHGGQVECNESVVSSGDLAAEGATCYWETATTGGVVTIYPQANRSQWDFGYSAKQMDGFMLTVRAAVEQLRN